MPVTGPTMQCARRYDTVRTFASNDSVSTPRIVLKGFALRRASKNIPGKASIFEYPSASAGVHSPAALPYTPFEAAISE